MSVWADAFWRLLRGESAECVEAVDPERITGAEDAPIIRSPESVEALREEQLTVKSVRLHKLDIFNRFTLADTAESPPASQAAPARCEVCGKRGKLLPFGVGPYTWLHMACWRGWFRSETDPEAWWVEVRAGLKRLPRRAS